MRHRMQALVLGVVYLIFFVSGAAALTYEVLWVRYLSLVFGGSHLAVTTVLAVFMGGLAIGSITIGKKVGSYRKLLRLYGFLELGIAASALVFVALMRFYPVIYIPLAQISYSPVYLSIIRITFAAVAMIIPTTLMGGTLPVLSAFISSHSSGLGNRLSFLYGFNTIGAVVGAAASGFLLLPHYSVNTTLTIAVSMNVLIGVLSIILQNKAQSALSATTIEAGTDTGIPFTPQGEHKERPLSLKLVLWGIGVSGFCALGYEVLWTRILSIVIGASVYGFTLLLMAFLAGIGLGSAAYGLFLRISSPHRKASNLHSLSSVVSFGLVQVIIGVSALLVSVYIRSLPSNAVSVYDFFQKLNMAIRPFKTRQLANFVISFSFLFVPAFFMGVAFPLAGKIYGQYKRVVGQTVGEILSYNTIGAILGSAVSGFILIYLLGIQRSLQIIILINIGFGTLVMASVLGKKSLNWGIAGAITIAALILVINPNLWQLWDAKFYAIYQYNHPEIYSTPEKIREAMDNSDVLYYGEGVHAIVSSVRSGKTQYFITNGRVEASDADIDMQCQYTLGHLPMLLNKNPRKVFVLGTGSGMTLGATSVHPSVEQITLAEIEPKVLGVARTFGIYNHYVLDNPKLKIVFNDGRNFLMTTKEKFDVITADPIHPWFSGAGYLYSSEYFKLAAQHLNPGGIACQWLPLYELTDENLKSIVATFRNNFSYIMVWLTHNDAELIGSNSPIIIDEKDLSQRIKVPEIQEDLIPIKMGSAEDFLSYFVMGSEGAKAYSNGGRINTDDNLYLEFSAPHSIGKTQLMGTNMSDLVKYRENILPYLVTPTDEATRAKQKLMWEKNLKAAVLEDQAHVLTLTGRYNTPEFNKLSTELDAHYLAYAPWRFLKNEGPEEKAGMTRLLKQIEFSLVNKKGEITSIQFAAVIIQGSGERSSVFFVDNNARIVFGRLSLRGAGRDAYIKAFVDDVINSVQALYNKEQKMSAACGKVRPSIESLLPKIRYVVGLKVDKEKT
jgi:spermidine synthase